MHTAKLRKVGGSVMLAVPPAVLDMLGLQAGAEVGVAVDDGRLIIEPRKPPRYTLAELLVQCEPDATRSGEDSEWLGGVPAGRELI